MSLACECGNVSKYLLEMIGFKVWTSGSADLHLTQESFRKRRGSGVWTVFISAVNRKQQKIKKNDKWVFSDLTNTNAGLFTIKLI